MNLQQIIANFTKSPKTTFGGVLIGLMILIPQIGNFTGHPLPQMDPHGEVVRDENGDVVMNEPSEVNWPSVVLGLGFIWLGSQARDNDKPSEKAIR
jgi:hypothetical protein